jgi:phosphoribosylanthranilate isomerase
MSDRLVVKICGVTTVADAEVVVGAGADLLGMVLAPGSKRRCNIEVAQAIVAGHQHNVVCVGVFKCQADHEILEAVQQTRLSAVQLHDEVSQDLLDALRAHGVTLIIRAVSYGTNEYRSVDEDQFDYILVDGPEPGSGVGASWAADQRTFTRPVIVAGGLTTENVGEWVTNFNIAGVDVASGTETTPGVKDPNKVASFINTARAAWRGPKEE